MAPRRKQKPVPGQLRPFKIYLPQDVGDRIEQKAKAKGWPQARVIINELADHPRLEQIGELADQVNDMKTVLAQYGSRVAMDEISKALLAAVDSVLAAEGGAREAAIDKLRVARRVMLKHEKQ
jgi:3-deoxy-D-manno-octulosonate 8-phosphate phosphatase KdsC-like HAD superfamily phosphatase